MNYVFLIYDIEAPLRFYSDKRLGIGKISEKYPRLNENITSFRLDIHNPSLDDIGIRITNDFTTFVWCKYVV